MRPQESLVLVLVLETVYDCCDSRIRIDAHGTSGLNPSKYVFTFLKLSFEVYLKLFFLLPCSGSWSGWILSGSRLLPEGSGPGFLQKFTFDQMFFSVRFPLRPPWEACSPLERAFKSQKHKYFFIFSPFFLVGIPIADRDLRALSHSWSEPTALLLGIVCKKISIALVVFRIKS